MTADTETDLGDTMFDLMFAPGCYRFAQREGDEVYWYDWCVDFPDDDPPHTLFTSG